MATWNRIYRNLSASIFIGAACFAFAAEVGTNITVSGWVIDSSCAYSEGLDKPIGVACARECAKKNGSTLVILRRRRHHLPPHRQ